jgi:2,4-dienoyl-CoA reductase (NADPH2)
MDRYPRIFSPGRIGSLTTKNRIKYAATETNFNTSDGYVTSREVAYMEAQARGGAGIVTTQGAYPDRKGEGKGFRGMMAICDDRFIPGLAGIAEVIRSNGALSCIQILHCGREGGVELDYSLMPTVVPQKLSYFKPPREITLEEIKTAIDDHAEAARRAVEAGFDMIELSGIVGYLLSTFVSSYTNKRADGYGGKDIRSRCRLMVEVIGAVKAQVGDKVPVGIRLCGLELLDDRGGNTKEESMESFRIAEEAGADFLSVTVGWHESSTSVITRDVPMGHWLWVAQEVKQHVSVPVMMAFRQFLPSIPEKAMAEGAIDYWEVCRPMIADPDLPRKAAEGREGEIAPCIACNVCFSRLYYHEPIMCTVRPTVGYEGDKRWGYYGFEPAQERRRIVVLGAGPAGLQFGAVAASRGHEVTILEQGPEPGGAVLMASQVDEGAIELLRTVGKLETDCRNGGVEIRVNCKGTAQLIAELAPEQIVVAAGAVIVPPPMPVSVPLYGPGDAIRAAGAVPRRVLILGGDGVGLGLAVFLLRHGDHEITVVEESGILGRDVNPFYLWQYMGLMRKRKVAFLTGSRITAAEGKTMVVTGEKGEKRVEVDGLVTAQRRPVTPSDLGLGATAVPLLVIGDAKKPRRLLGAIHDGYRRGMEA